MQGTRLGIFFVRAIGLGQTGRRRDFPTAKPQNPTERGEAMPLRVVDTFYSELPFTLDSEADLVLVVCSDWRFSDDGGQGQHMPVPDGHLQRFEKRLQGQGLRHIDHEEFPGGPGAFIDDESANVTHRWTQLLTGLHGLREVFLLSHGDCGAYKARYPGKTAEDLLEIQQGDLIEVREQLERAFAAAGHEVKVRIGMALP